MNYLEESLTIYCFHDIGVLMKGMVKSGAWIQKRRSTFFVKIWDCDIVVILAKFFDLSLAHFFDIYNFLWNTFLKSSSINTTNLIFFISKIYFWMWRMKLNSGWIMKFFKNKRRQICELLLIVYRTRAIITRGLYTFYPLFKVQKRFLTGFFS